MREGWGLPEGARKTMKLVTLFGNDAVKSGLEQAVHLWRTVRIRRKGGVFASLAGVYDRFE